MRVHLLPPLGGITGTILVMSPLLLENKRNHVVFRILSIKAGKEYRAHPEYPVTPEATKL
ncbi:hypothetical protein J6590_106978, partial [Homalodisca vitripennis]